VSDTRQTGPFERILTVIIAGETLAKAEAKASRRLSREVKIKGFRPGKAPRQLVEKVVGAETLRREAVDVALPEAVAEAIRESDLSPVVTPRVDDLRDVDGGVEVDVLITLWPTLESLPEYRGRRIEVDPPRLGEGEVEERIEQIRHRFAELEDVQREAADGDYVVVDVLRADGAEFVKEMMYEVGSGSFLEGIDMALRGARAGFIEEFDTEFPGAEGEPEAVVARVLVKQVKSKRLPELTDEWVDDVSEFETVAEMRERLEQDLTDLKVRGARLVFGERLMEALVEDVGLDLPEALVEAEMETVLHRFARDLSHRGIGIDQYLTLTGQEQGAFIDDLRIRASLNLKTRILLDGVAAAEGIEVGPDEVDAVIAGLAEAAGVEAGEYRSALEKGDRVQTLAGDILRDKAMRRLVELAVPVDAEGEVVDLPEPDRDEAPDAGEAVDAGDGPESAEDEDEE